MITDAMITDAIQKAPKNQYGQTEIFDKRVNALFPNNVEEVIKHLETSQMYTLDTYGGKCGTYKAICKRY